MMQRNIVEMCEQSGVNAFAHFHVLHSAKGKLIPLEIDITARVIHFYLTRQTLNRVFLQVS